MCVCVYIYIYIYIYIFQIYMFCVDSNLEYLRTHVIMVRVPRRCAGASACSGKQKKGIMFQIACFVQTVT